MSKSSETFNHSDERIHFPPLISIPIGDNLIGSAMPIVLAVVLFIVERDLHNHLVKRDPHSGPIWFLLVPAMILLLVSACYMAQLFYPDYKNHRIRREWAKSFERRIHPKQLPLLFAQDADRYVLHVRYYGGWDVAGMKPSIVLEDTNTSSVAAVYPPKDPHGWSEKFGVRIVRH